MRQDFDRNRVSAANVYKFEEFEVNLKTFLSFDSEVIKERDRIDGEIRTYNSKLAEIEAILKDSEDKRDDLMDQTSREKNSNAEKDKELSDLNKQFELEKEKEVILQSDK